MISKKRPRLIREKGNQQNLIRVEITRGGVYTIAIVTSHHVSSYIQNTKRKVTPIPKIRKTYSKDEECETMKVRSPDLGSFRTVASL